MPYFMFNFEGDAEQESFERLKMAAIQTIGVASSCLKHDRLLLRRIPIEGARISAGRGFVCFMRCRHLPRLASTIEHYRTVGFRMIYVAGAYFGREENDAYVPGVIEM